VRHGEGMLGAMAIVAGFMPRGWECRFCLFYPDYWVLVVFGSGNPDEFFRWWFR